MDPITRVESTVTLEEMKGKLVAYEAAHGTQQRRQCVEDLRKAMTSLDPADHETVEKEMERISTAHLWKVLNLAPENECRPNSRVEEALKYLKDVESVVSKAVLPLAIPAGYAFGVLIPLLRHISAADDTDSTEYWTNSALGVLGAVGQVAALEAGVRVASAMRQKAEVSWVRTAVFTPMRSAGQSKGPEITELLSAVFDRVSSNSASDRRQCAMAVVSLLVNEPRLIEALARFAHTGDATVLDAPLKGVDNRSVRHERRLAACLPLDPELRYAQRCLEERRLNTVDAMETVKEARESRKQDKTQEANTKEPDLTDSSFRDEVQKALNGRQPFDEGGIHYGVLQDLKKEIGTGKKPGQIFKACLLEVRSDESGTPYADPTVEDRLDRLIAKHRELLGDRAASLPS